MDVKVFKMTKENQKITKGNFGKDTIFGEFGNVFFHAMFTHLRKTLLNVMRKIPKGGIVRYP